LAKRKPSSFSKLFLAFRLTPELRQQLHLERLEIGVAAGKMENRGTVKTRWFRGRSRSFLQELPQQVPTWRIAHFPGKVQIPFEVAAGEMETRCP